MHSIVLEARAKINLSLFVLGKRSDGYHDIETLMQSVDLADMVTMKRIKEGIDIRTSMSVIPDGTDNIAYRAAKAFYRYTHITPGVSVFIDKHIPVGAGLGGGSADAAATLVGLNMLYGTGLSEDELRELGAECGSDVPFCIRGGTAVARGRGEILEFIDDVRDFLVVLVKPRFSTSTKRVYQALCIQELDMRLGMSDLIANLRQGDLVHAGIFIHNDLEDVVGSSHPVILTMRQALYRAGAAGALMTGSGSTVFGIFADDHEHREIMKRCRIELSSVNIETILMSTTVKQGVVVRPDQGYARIGGDNNG
jgi:4-diphosphocytidyl-2-C-methyl-D-erythritol kinase